jgi:hypothetical protein
MSVHDATRDGDTNEDLEDGEKKGVEGGDDRRERSGKKSREEGSLN